MKIAVLSDIHDHIWNLEKVANAIRGKVDRIIYLGDFCAPFTAGLLAQIGVPVTSTLGNNDEDQIGLSCQGGDLFTWIPLF
ncbi:MAG TPA: metallophosphoesterase, partial [Verrucomicrobia bacterium]|nr:metallophosphoesterase [Verrucomicrobiota bacterium]